MVAPFLAAVLPSLVSAVPSLIRIFGSGARAEANAKAAEIVVAAAKEATGAVNEQDLVEKLESKDPEVIRKVEEAVQSVWYEITVDSGGIEGARTASREVQTSFLKQPAFWITLLLLPLPYAVVSSVLGIWPTGLNYSDEIRVMVVTAVISGVLSGITGFWLGTSFSSSRKTELLRK
jgi:hypothetical protein